MLRNTKVPRDKNQTIAPSETALQPFEQFSIECCQEIAVIGPENSRPSLNQSDAKLKPLTTLSPTFSRAVSSLVGFTMGSHWLLKLFSFLLIGLRQLTDKRSMEQRISRCQPTLLFRYISFSLSSKCIKHCKS